MKFSIKASRVNARLKLKDAAEVLKKTERWLRDVENGATSISKEDLDKLCEAYGIDIEQLDVTAERFKQNV